ncbi:SapC family protein [Desulfovibrio sp. JC022]|uniref:SapC family protein n=1 Tax=Desulfovibrio sp. JC022 TaxID=2593642 RepID=UPI0013D74C0F|nr:SapC family protein [Desulfovibrio sp. JC022]NDV24265.1 SapC family protein [Desulfovibrio sp. JC022]
MKMVPLNKNEHAAYKIRTPENMDFAAGAHFARLVLAEFVQACSVFPIIFVENADIGGFDPGVMLGFEPGQNFFVDGEGKWLVPFVPASIRQYPFSYSYFEGQPDKWVLLFDEDSGLLNIGAGEPLFDEEGRESTTLNNIMQFMGELQAAAAATTEFSAYLADKSLIVPLDIKVPGENCPHSLQGIYGVNGQRLNELPDDVFLELKNKGYLAVIYAHLISLGQIERLVALSPKV